MMAVSFLMFSRFVMCLLNVAVVSAASPFLTSTPGQEWKMVGYLDMTDPTQQCPDSWRKITSPRSSCGKKSSQLCDSLNVTTSGANYQTVCGRFRGYQIGSTDAFNNFAGLPRSIETYYVDGVTVTYGSPGSRRHVYTYAAGAWEINDESSCPCAGGRSPPLLVGSDYYCESGDSGPIGARRQQLLYSSDVLWDKQQCGGNETTCCNRTDLPWFCKTFPTPISENLEVRICTDESLDNENVAIEAFELYIEVATPLVNIQAASVRNPDNTLHQLEIYWIPVGGNVIAYTVTVVGANSSVSQGCTACTTSPCLYVHQVTREANNYSIFVTSINEDGTFGTQNSITFSPSNSIFKNVSSLSNSNFIGCSFLNNQSFYCVVCCSSDPSVPPESSVYNTSTTRGTEVIVSLQGLTSGQMYYCKAAATNTNSTQCTDPVVGDVKTYFAFVASLSPSFTITCTSHCLSLTSIDMSALIGIIIFTSLFGFVSLAVLVVTCVGCMVRMKSKVVHQPALQSTDEMVEIGQKKVTTIKMEVNAAYAKV